MPMNHQSGPISEHWNVVRLAFLKDHRINRCFVCKARPAEPFRVKDLAAGRERAKDLIGLCAFHRKKFGLWLEGRRLSAALLVHWIDRRHPDRSEVLRRRWQKPMPLIRSIKRGRLLHLTEEQRHKAAQRHAESLLASPESRISLQG